jgi:hypothetical protein
MPWLGTLPMRMFGHPKGVLGRLGGMIIARMNRDAAEQVIELLDVQSDDKILEVGFGPGVAIQLLLHRSRPHPSPGSKSRRKWCIKRWPSTPTRCAAVNQRPRSGRDQYAHDATRHVAR